jgi:hypothetical protein
MSILRLTVVGLFFSIKTISYAELIEQVQTFDFEQWTNVAHEPAQAKVIEGSFTLNIPTHPQAQGKALEVTPTPLAAAQLQLGPSARGNASITASILSSKAARSYPQYGITLYGNSGLKAILNPAKKQLELWKADELLKTTPLSWQDQQWYRLNLRASIKPDQSFQIDVVLTTTGPTATSISITHHLPKLSTQGKAGLIAIPYSGTPIYFDQVQLSVQTEQP